jgi:hypothetical protein
LPNSHINQSLLKPRTRPSEFFGSPFSLAIARVDSGTVRLSPFLVSARWSRRVWRLISDHF